MKTKFNSDRTKLTITVNYEEIQDLRELGEAIQQDQTMQEWLEPITCNSDLDWIDPSQTGDLTSAPMLGILGEEGDKDRTVFQPNFGLVSTGFVGHNEQARPILERLAFMDYQVRSVLETLRDNCQAVFVGGKP